MYPTVERVAIAKNKAENAMRKAAKAAKKTRSEKTRRAYQKATSRFHRLEWNYYRLQANAQNPHIRTLKTIIFEASMHNSVREHKPFPSVSISGGGGGEYDITME